MTAELSAVLTLVLMAQGAIVAARNQNNARARILRSQVEKRGGQHGIATDFDGFGDCI